MPKKKSSKANPGGLWYFVYLRPDWIIEFNTKIRMAPLFWYRTILPMLTDHYKLDDAAWNKVRVLPFSMPHGSAFIDGDDAYVWITGGFPQMKLAFDPLNQIVSALGLTRYLSKGRVQVEEIPCDYETQEMQRTELQQIIGKVPY